METARIIYLMKQNADFLRDFVMLLLIFLDDTIIQTYHIIHIHNKRGSKKGDNMYIIDQL